MFKLKVVAMMAVSVMAIQGFVPDSRIYAQAQESAASYRKELNIRDFNSIETRVAPSSGRGRIVTGYYSIKVIKSDAYKVVLNVHDASQADLYEVSKSGNSLVLLTKSKKISGGSGITQGASVTVYMPDIQSLSINGANTLSTQGDFSGKTLDIHVSGAASLYNLSGRWDYINVLLEGGAGANSLSLKAGKMDLKFSGASSVLGKTVLEATEYMNLSSSGGAGASISELSVPDIDMNLSGAANLKVLKVSVTDMNAQLSGGACLNMSGKVENNKATLSGAAQMVLSGRGGYLEVMASGAAALKAKSMSVKSASVSLSGASSAELTVTDKIKSSASVASTLIYYGNPKEVTNVR